MHDLHSFKKISKVKIFSQSEEVLTVSGGIRRMLCYSSLCLRPNLVSNLQAVVNVNPLSGGKCFHFLDSVFEIYYNSSS